ncbi:MAG: XdhC family protein [Flavobacteriaceae bacterium]
MKEIKSIIQLYQSQKTNGEKAAIAQVVRVEESSYRREGARMLVFESGVFEGGISGGCLEGDALQRSQIAILKQEPSIVTYDTSKDDENQIGVGLGCNGVIDVLISPISDQGRQITILEKCVKERKAHCIVTITDFQGGMEDMKLGDAFYLDIENQTLEHCNNKEFANFVLENLSKVLEKKRSQTFVYTSGNVKLAVLIELIPPQFHLAIYGDNYDVYPMLSFAKVLDWEVSLVGNVQKLKKEKLRSVKNFYLKDAEQRPKLDDRTAVILMAHDYNTDITNLKSVLESPAPYIASLGPRKRFEKMIKDFTANGFEITKENQNRIFAPCGLEIGANTPEEIATSIFAEILTVFSGKMGGMLRKKMGPIHQRH